MNDGQIIDWLLSGDVSVQYQTYRDLLAVERPDLQQRILAEGWGKQFLDRRNASGSWGDKFYFPKWTSTHYTLLDIRNLCPDPDAAGIRTTITTIGRSTKNDDGGIALSGETKYSDVCVNGIFLNYASYFSVEEATLTSLVDMLLRERMPDGGFNCRSNRSGAVHSSLHSTLSVLEGFVEYEKNGYQYRIDEIRQAITSSLEFMLLHQLFRSDHTGAVIDKRFLQLSYPARWRYDILRALDLMCYAAVNWNPNIKPAMDVILQKQNRDGTWNVQARHPGQIHFEMEKAGKPSRWNTLRALRVLRRYT